MAAFLKDREANEIIKQTLEYKGLAVFTTTNSQNCDIFMDFLKSTELDFKQMVIDSHALSGSILGCLNKLSGQKNPPFVFFKSQFVGNHESIIRLYHNALLKDVLAGKVDRSKFDFDVIIVGGSAEGLAMAIEAGHLGKSVGLFDNTPFNAQHTKSLMYPSIGSMTGNGMLVKSLMLHSCLTGELGRDGNFQGWNFSQNKTYDWSSMMSKIYQHIVTLNHTFKTYFSSTKVKVFSARILKFLNDHTALAEDIDNRQAKFTGQVFVIATGGIPKPLSFRGAEYAIPLENLIYLPNKPIKILIIGAGPIALEYAGILRSLDVEVSILVKSKLMKNFDLQITSMIVSHMESIGINFIYTDKQFEIFERRFPYSEYCKSKACAVNDSYKPDFLNQNKTEHEFQNLPYRLKISEGGAVNPSGNEFLFDHIFLATGRKYTTNTMGLEEIGVKFNKETRKIIVNKYDRTHCHTVFAIGDVCYARPEPVSPALKSGLLLAKRMFGFHEVMNHNHIPLAILTPLEYAFCGYTEEKAVQKYTREKINIYHSNFYPLQWVIQKRNEHRCYMKVICSQKENDRVLGVHILGPSASEIIQGIALSMKFHLRKSHLDDFVGVHSTNAEALFWTQSKYENKSMLLSGKFVPSVKTNF